MYDDTLLENHKWINKSIRIQLEGIGTFCQDDLIWFKNLYEYLVIVAHKTMNEVLT